MRTNFKRSRLLLLVCVIVAAVVTLMLTGHIPAVLNASNAWVFAAVSLAIWLGITALVLLVRAVKSRQKPVIRTAPEMSTLAFPPSSRGPLQ